jgi:predicted nucleic acid-binding protein
VIDLVIDANVVLAWIRPDDEPHAAQALSVFDAYTAGRAQFVVPPLAVFEVLNVAARKWRWPEPQLLGLADSLAGIGFVTSAPALHDVARWAATGLSAYDAAYVAVAETIGAELITADQQIVAAAPDHARPLADVEAVAGLSG